jgi:hypothetical protein
VDVSTLQSFLATSPIARLFRRDNPATIVAFLNRTFIETPRMAVQEGQLIAMLRDFSEEAAVLGEKPVGDPVKTVEDWCSENFGILTKYFDRDGEVVCEMTADAHRVVSFIQNLTTTEFVAAESKIKALWRDIENMVERATSNPGAFNA